MAVSIRFSHAPDETGLWGTVANAINDRGQIAGAFGDLSGIVRGYFKDGDLFKNLDYPETPAVNTYPTGINNKGVIAGNYWPANATTNIDDGFVYSNGHFTKVDYPKAAATSVNRNNDAGDLVGNWFDSRIRVTASSPTVSASVTGEHDADAQCHRFSYGDSAGCAIASSAAARRG